MTLQRIPGGGLLLMPPLHSYLGLTTASRHVMSAAGHKIAVIGNVWTPGRASKSLRKIHFLTSTIAINSASSIQIACQDLDTSNSNPPRGDGVNDQTVSISGAAITSNAWVTSGSLSSDRSVAWGDTLVLEFTFATFTAADSFTLQNYSNSQTGSGGQSYPAVVAYTTSWGLTVHQPNILLEFSDGTFGCFDGCYPTTGLTGVSFNSASTPDERALKFQVPFACSIDGVYGFIEAFAAGADYSVVLYNEAGTAISTKAISGATYVNSDSTLVFHCLPETDLDANTWYYLAVKPTTTNNCRFNHWTVNAAGHAAVWPLGTTGYLSTRTDAGAWSDTTTGIPALFPRFSRFHDGAGGAWTPRAMTGGFTA